MNLRGRSVAAGGQAQRVPKAHRWLHLSFCGSHVTATFVGTFLLVSNGQKPNHYSINFIYLYIYLFFCGGGGPQKKRALKKVSLLGVSP